jgi:predicted RNA-binding protein with PUA-like domain
MRHWIFQSRPDRYDLRREGVLRPGETDSWVASRYRELMQPGDVVYFWLSGDPKHKGIYGRGHLTSAPYKRSDGYLVDVMYDEKFESPINVADIVDNPELESLQIVRIPIGTNFLVDEGQARALNKLESAAA